MIKSYLVFLESPGEKFFELNYANKKVSSRR